jgi:perosamine synthetase
MTIALPDHTDDLITEVRKIFGSDFVPLHRPVFEGHEKKYLIDCIDSNFVSSVGAKVTEFEEKIAAFMGVRYAVATVNGTAALHVALQLAGVQRNDEVLSQALTFVATCNAISYVGAKPVFVDVDRGTLGMSPDALLNWLEHHTIRRDGQTFNRLTGARIAACVPMHTFGIPIRIQQLVSICDAWGIPVIEDAAESLGSYVGSQHTGTFGKLATLSFNGNKIITTGGGGMIVTNDESVAKHAKHLTTTAKVPHSFEFVHDEIGYNYRLPNLNAALGCAQMEKLPVMLEIKSEVADRYRQFCEINSLEFLDAPKGTKPNFWLNALVLSTRSQRDAFLRYTNDNQVMTRPIWRLMSTLDMFKHCQHDGLVNSIWLEDRVVNIPSSVPESEFWRIRA